jgi:hypothetical protein
LKISKQLVKESKHAYGDVAPHQTVVGMIGRNKMDTHADTCCVGANWRLLDSTNMVCQVTLFLDSCEPMKEVMVMQCGTVWTSPNTGHEYLLVGDQMLWFGSQMDHSHINPNWICEYGLPVYDDSFLSCSLVLMETKPSFPSILQGLLFTSILMCRQIGKPVICQLLGLQEKNGIQ